MPSATSPTSPPNLSPMIAAYNARQYGQCAAGCRHLLAKFPGHASILHLLGLALAGLDQSDEALLILTLAKAAAPADAIIRLDLAETLAAHGDSDAALAELAEARKLAPQASVVPTNMATLHQSRGEIDAAITLYRQAIALDPNDAAAHSNLGASLLTQGQWRQGFAEFEWRLHLPALRKPPTALPVWRGQPLAGKHLLITAEQGYGDQLQYARFLPALTHLASKLTVECKPGLERLFGNIPGVTAVVSQGQPLPMADYTLPLPSLADRLGWSAQAEPPYLTPLPGPAFALPGDAPVKIGLVWASQTVSGNGFERRLHGLRSCPLASLAPLARLPGIGLYALQQSWTSAELATSGLAISDLAPRLGDFADTAAAIAALDLVITIDSAVAHLAGALGKPLWVLLGPGQNDYRWGQGETSPWYPQARLFRAQGSGWGPVIEQIRQALPNQMAKILCGRAMAHHQAGALAEAVALYQQAIAADPSHAPAHCNLGEALARLGQTEQALTSYGAAVALKPDFAEAWNNMGAVLLDRGDDAPAEQAFRQALSHRPAFVEAMNNLGNCLRRQDRLDEAIDLHRDAVALAPAYPQAHNSLGNALKCAFRFAEAEASYAQAIALLPDYAEAHINRAGALLALGRLEEALAATIRALSIRPDFPEAAATIDLVLTELGIALLQQNQFEQAQQICQMALARNPQEAEPHFRLGNVFLRQKRFEEAEKEFLQAIDINPNYAPAYNNLGSIALEREQTQEALRRITKAVSLDSGLADIHNNLGNALRAAGQQEAAMAAYAQAIALRADFPEAFNNLGVLMGELGLVDGSLASFEQAIRHKPSYAEAYSNMGNVLKSRRRTDDAVAAYRRSLEIRPDYHGARLNLAIALLQQGHWLEGWEEYRVRWDTGALRRQKVNFTQPEWSGEPLDGKTILFYGEQGFGDVLQFIRYAPLLAERGAKVIALVHKALVRLFASAPGLAEVRAYDNPPPAFDYHLAMMSAPRVFATTPATIPAAVPYLAADPAEAEAWRQRLAGLTGFKVGLVWSGDPRPHDLSANILDRQRSLSLGHFAFLADIPGLSLVNLQKGGPASQLKSPPPGLTLWDAMDEITDFAGTAALVANLDLVISVDTSMVHLVGALGKPVWILSRYDGCWRWPMDHDHTPWYPTARLFWQTAPNDWREALANVANALKLL